MRVCGGLPFFASPTHYLCRSINLNSFFYVTHLYHVIPSRGPPQLAGLGRNAACRGLCGRAGLHPHRLAPRHAGSAIPALPLFSTLGALLLCLIEVKSVMENSHRPSDINRAVDSASRLLDDKSLRRLIHTLSELTDSQPKRENKENDNC